MSKGAAVVNLLVKGTDMDGVNVKEEGKSELKISCALAISDFSVMKVPDLEGSGVSTLFSVVPPFFIITSLVDISETIVNGTGIRFRELEVGTLIAVVDPSDIDGCGEVKCKANGGVTLSSAENICAFAVDFLVGPTSVLCAAAVHECVILSKGVLVKVLVCDTTGTSVNGSDMKCRGVTPWMAEVGKASPFAPVSDASSVDFTVASATIVDVLVT